MKSKPNKQYAACRVLIGLNCLVLVSACSPNFKNASMENSPTSGTLNVYYDEGLEPHVINQKLTFESQYPHAQINLFLSSESEAVHALYVDCCEIAVISRGLSALEKKAFASKKFFPRYSAVAKSGIALITNSATPIDKLSYEQMLALLTKSFVAHDSANREVPLNVIFDKNNSSVIHYLSDSLLKGAKFSANCNTLGSTLESINYVAKNKNTIAFIDFSWLSDKDDSLYKANRSRLKFICIGNQGSKTYEYPSQSSFKLNTYPLTRTVYVYRKTGDYTLAKGFESFMAGPKGQLIFLKQGLLPTRQNDRQVHISIKPLHDE